MRLERIYDQRLAQASYLIACATCGEAMVVDPSRDITPYLQRAAAGSLRITRVAETHIHADYVSGTRELVAATGAAPFLSGDGGPDWQYHFAARDHATLMHDGDVIEFGNVRVTVMHTPGHTPEHVSLLLADTSRGDAPTILLSGDFVFVGDVGRPDLLERAAGVADSSAAAARELFRSLQRLAPFPDSLEIWPGHGAGSACGKALGNAPSTTLGHERRHNAAFQPRDADSFAASVLEGQSVPPPYFARMKQVNRSGPCVVGTRPPLASMKPDEFDQALRDGMVLDVRSQKEHAAAHLRGTLGIPLNQSFTKWAGWLVPNGRPVYLIATSAEMAGNARVALASIGIDEVAGWFGPNLLAAGRPLTSTDQGTIVDAPRRQRDGTMIVDVREIDEWQAGHLDGAAHHPLGALPRSMAGIDRHTPVAVHCAGGSRSAIAASMLEQMGFEQVTNLADGWGGWMRRDTLATDG